MIFPKFKTALFLILSFLFATQASAVVVHDPTSFAKLVEQLRQMKSQVTEMKKQTQMLKDLKGYKGFGRRSYDSSLNDYLPKGSSNLSDFYNSGHSDVKRMKREIIHQVNAEKSYREQEESLKERPLDQAAHRKATALKALEGSDRRLKQIESLMTEIEQTQDAKSIQELQARIALEQAMLENESNKIKLMHEVNASDEQLREIEERKMLERIFDPSNKNMPRIK